MDEQDEDMTVQTTPVLYIMMTYIALFFSSSDIFLAFTNN